MSYVERQIIVTITLQTKQGAPELGVAPNANPTFRGTTSNTVKLTGGGKADKNGLRIATKVTYPGQPSLGEAIVQIYNLPLPLINQLGTLGVSQVYRVGKNEITIEAGDAGSLPATIFKGTIYLAYADFSGVPDVIFNISAQAGPFALQGAVPAPAVGYKGGVQPSTLIQNISSQFGYTCINNFPPGGTPQLSNQYLCGSFKDQIKKIANNANIGFTVDDTKKQIILFPKNGSSTLSNAPIAVIGPPPVGNMVGYPAYTDRGIKVKTEFGTGIGYAAKVQVKGSQLEQANGIWVVYYLDYDLECQAPDGPWFTNLELGFPATTPIFPISVP